MKTFVVWLNNHTDRRDDEWIKVQAKSIKDIDFKSLSFDRYRFSIGTIMTVADFKKQFGMNP